LVRASKLRYGEIQGKEESMHDLQKIKSTVALDPLPFLTSLYGDSVRRCGNELRVGRKGGRCFFPKDGELICATFNGDAGQGDIFAVWQAHHTCSFATAVEQIAAIYGITQCDESAPRRTPQAPQPPKIDPDFRLSSRPELWPLISPSAGNLFDDACANLSTISEARREIANWRGWSEDSVRRFAVGRILGFIEFDLWPTTIRPQPAAMFRVLQPHESVDAAGARFWHLKPVQLHIRFRPGATRRDGTALSWIYAPSMKEVGATDGGNAPLVLADFNRDPEQPGWSQHCETIIVCAGEWDALTVLIAADWIDETGRIRMPKGVAVVGIRGEGRGGTDAFFRWYAHWPLRNAILVADADATGATWFASPDHRPCFAEQLEKRGVKVVPRAPKKRDGIKDINDLYRAGLLHASHIAELLANAGHSKEGGAQ
jgi:hypothetical protein